MPQLNKEGKFVFGLFVIRSDLTSKNSRGKSRQVNYCMKWRRQFGLQGNTYKLFI